MSISRKELLKHHGLSVQSHMEEVFNATIHLIGFGLSIAGLCLMIIKAQAYGSIWHVVGSAIFGSSLILLYLISTLYHSLPWISVKKIFRRLDHISIYILIAGSYTPLALTFLRPSVGWIIFGVAWGLAAIGTAFKAIYGNRYNVVATLGYVLMGWLIVIAYNPILEHFPKAGLIWLIAGGLCYTGGVIFYFLDQKIKFFHALWHVVVLAGSICHFLAVYWYIIPAYK